MAEFRMPSLGSDMDAGTLVAWRKKPGDVVQRGDVLAEVETDKGLIEVDTFQAGVLERTLVEPGSRVPVGTLLATLSDALPSPRAPAAPTAARPGSPPAVRPEVPVTVASPPPRVVSEPEARPPSEGSLTAAPAFLTPGQRIPASPFARRRALELGIDLSRLTGTGRHGTISAVDVERAAAAMPPLPLPAAPAASGPSTPSQALSPEVRMRRAIAATMTRAKREIPHFYLSTTIDMSPALDWLRAFNEAHAVEARLLPAALLLKASALALRKVPALNARWLEHDAPPIEEVNLGVAISLRGGGLVAPAIRGAAGLDLSTIMAQLTDLVTRARAGTLRASEMADATATVTSLGERGAEGVLPVIFPPQVAMLGFGKIVERPWVVGGAVVPRLVVSASLAVDHRVADGHLASRLLEAVERALTAPSSLDATTHTGTQS